MDSAETLRDLLNAVWRCPKLREVVFASPELGGFLVVEADPRGG